MKKTLSLIIILFFSIIAFGQAPQAFKYQAVARGNTGNVLADQNISVKLTILNGSYAGYAVYVESQQVVTNQYGLFSIEVGNGSAEYGFFSNINWKEGTYYLQTEIDINGGTDYQLMGTTQILSIPYSFYSEIAGSVYLTDENGNNYTLGVDTLGNITTNLVLVNTWMDCGDTLIDNRDGQKYPTVLIGSQCWMAKNLNMGIRIEGAGDQTDNLIIEKYCYNDLESNCTLNGGLYQWNEIMQYETTAGAQGICPSEWHVPSDEEWKQLEGEVDSLFSYPDPEWDNTLFRGYNVGLNLKSLTGWAEDGNGTDLYGYAALAGGHRFSDTNFFGIGYYATFWTSSQTYSGEEAFFRRLFWTENKVNRTNAGKDFAYSIRCLKD